MEFNFAQNFHDSMNRSQDRALSRQELSLRAKQIQEQILSSQVQRERAKADQALAAAELDFRMRSTDRNQNLSELTANRNYNLGVDRNQQGWAGLRIQEEANDKLADYRTNSLGLQRDMWEDKKKHRDEFLNPIMQGRYDREGEVHEFNMKVEKEAFENLTKNLRPYEDLMRDFSLLSMTHDQRMNFLTRKAKKLEIDATETSLDEQKRVLGLLHQLQENRATAGFNAYTADQQELMKYTTPEEYYKTQTNWFQRKWQKAIGTYGQGMVDKVWKPLYESGTLSPEDQKRIGKIIENEEDSSWFDDLTLRQRIEKAIRTYGTKDMKVQYLQFMDPFTRENQMLSAEAGILQSIMPNTFQQYGPGIYNSFTAPGLNEMPYGARGGRNLFDILYGGSYGSIPEIPTVSDN